jgi:hypothetical protein
MSSFSLSLSLSFSPPAPLCQRQYDYHHQCINAIAISTFVISPKRFEFKMGTVVLQGFGIECDQNFFTIAVRVKAEK